MTGFQWYLAATGLLTMVTAWWIYGTGGVYWQAKDQGDYISEVLSPYVVGAPAAMFVIGLLVKGVLVAIGS